VRVGKSGATRCDRCGEVITGIPDSIKIGDKLRHFCPESPCMEEWSLERHRPAILKEVDRLARIEREFLYKLICPGCKHRFVTKANARVDQLKVVCPHCNQEIDKAVM
jgi:formylmethanofuran dehydrogenase subunit E